MEYPSLKYEKRLWRKGLRVVAGIDEAGRGPLAGPVVAAAAYFTPGRIPKELKEVRDSKLIPEHKREALYRQIVKKAAGWSVGIVGNEAIDKVNILNATVRAMRIAVRKLKMKTDYIIIDGRFSERNLDYISDKANGAECIVRGDKHVFSIAAASIIAKVTRDRLMRRLAKKYPVYGFDIHKGYGTKAHYAALTRHGLCPLHRRTFFEVLNLGQVTRNKPNIQSKAKNMKNE
jgi:ribonuclease HII